MKRILFLFVSALLAGTTYATNLSKDVIAKVTNNSEISVSQSDQSLILEMPMNSQINADAHWSHGSHGSHGSHASHSSHVSSRF